MSSATRRLKPRVRIELVRDGDAQYGQTLSSAQRVYVFVRSELSLSDRERFLVLLLDNRNRVIGVDEAAVGTLSQALVHPREIFKAAILSNAASIICVHNHPSGDPDPSREDRKVTKRLEEAGKLLGIPLLDSVIIGVGRYHSANEQNELSEENPYVPR